MVNYRKFIEICNSSSESCDAVLNNAKRYIQCSTKLQTRGLLEDDIFLLNKSSISLLKKFAIGLLHLNTIAKLTGEPIVDHLVNVMNIDDCRALLKDFVESSVCELIKI